MISALRHNVDASALGRVIIVNPLTQVNAKRHSCKPLRNSCQGKYCSSEDEATTVDRVHTHSRGSALRCGLAILCALSFVAVVIAESVQCFDPRVPTFAFQADTGPAGSSPSSPNKVSPPIAHCHACTTFALPLFLGSVLPFYDALEVPLPKLIDVRSHPPGVATPIPIFAI